MKKIIGTVFLALQFWIAGTALATDCVSDSLAEYLLLGTTGCTVDSLLFSDFMLVSGPTDSTPFAAVQVTPSTSGTERGLEFVVDASANAGSFFDEVIGYTVTALGAPIVGGHLFLTGATATGTGAATAVNNLCLGGTFDPGGPTGCTGTDPTLIAAVIEGAPFPSDQTSFAATTSLAAFTDIGVDAGPDGTASLLSATSRFAVGAISPVPEPPLLLLMLSVLALLALVTRAQSKGKAMLRSILTALAAVVVLVAGEPANAASHREAPITALDQKADITDVYAFRSYTASGNTSVPLVTLIVDVDPFLEPGNGPNWFPFDPDILYEIKIDNNNDAVADIVFQFRFHTEQRLPDLFTVYAGDNGGVTAPANSPPPVAPGTLVVPPQITSFSSPGLGQRQSYTVTMVKGGVSTAITSSGGPFYAVPANVGPRTINYDALFSQGTYTTNVANVKVFAGTVDDPFWIDLGGAFDTFNLRSAVNGGVLTPAQDAALQNFASDTVSGYSVNTIAIEVPVSMLTRTGAIEAATSTAATIGVWGTTSRPRTTVRRAPLPAASAGSFSQIQRMGNPLINELLIGTGEKDRFSMDQPKNDAQFADFFLDPTLARVVNALTAGAVAIPAPPRTDLLPLVTYAPPIAAPGTPAGPIADLLRLNTGIPPTPPGSASRLGLLGGDLAGYPNGRRLFDDVTDISLRAVVGVLNPAFNHPPNNRLGDGVNVNDAPYRTAFPYFADAPSGRDRRHIDPGEPGCTASAGPPCPL